MNKKGEGKDWRKAAKKRKIEFKEKILLLNKTNILIHFPPIHVFTLRGKVKSTERFYLIPPWTAYCTATPEGTFTPTEEPQEILL